MKKIIIATAFIGFIACGNIFAQTSDAKSTTQETPAASAVAPAHDSTVEGAVAPVPAKKKSCCAKANTAGKSSCGSKSEASMKDCKHSEKAEAKTETAEPAEATPNN